MRSRRHVSHFLTSRSRGPIVLSHEHMYVDTTYVDVSIYGLKHVRTFLSFSPDLTLWALNSMGIFREDLIGAHVRKKRIYFAAASSSSFKRVDGTNARLSSSASDGGRRARLSQLGERLRCSWEEADKLTFDVRLAVIVG